jgi:AcrR family transcriptional regulator
MVRADAERSTARILEAAEAVLSTDPNASLEKIADAAGLARATVHRRFASRQTLLDALAGRLNDRYALGLEQARVTTAPPLIALHRLTETVFELKISYRFTMTILGVQPRPEVLAGLELLFSRLHATGAITADDPSWCRRVYLALMDPVHQLPPDSPTLDPTVDEASARAALLVRTTLGALGGPPA